MEQFNLGSFICGMGCAYLIIASYFMFEMFLVRKKNKKLEAEMEAFLHNARILEKQQYEMKRPVA